MCPIQITRPQENDCSELLVRKEYTVNWMQGGAWVHGDDEFAHFLQEDGDMSQFPLVQVQCTGTSNVPYQNAISNEKELLCACTIPKLGYNTST